jgi:membrane-associated phospholipid phosphatase
MNLKEYYHKYTRECWLVLAVILWTVPYFYINSFSVGRTERGFDTFLDSALPSIPATVLIYISIFMMIFMPYVFIKSKEHFKAVAKSYIVGMFIGYLTFLLLPVKVIRPLITEMDIFSKMLNLLYTHDFPYNSFPSLHVGLSLLSGLIIYNENEKWGKWMILWAMLISLSTLTTKQHTLIDVAGGIAVSMVSYWAYLKLVKKEINSSESSPLK